MTLRHLRIFVAVCTWGSITRAAEKLHMAQPSVSLAIRELEEYYQSFQEQNINLIGVASDSGESDEQLKTAQDILAQKGVTYTNLSPDPDNALYQDFISQLAGYPTTYVVDREGNIVGAPIIGNVKEQEETLNTRLEQAMDS